uniref:Uncharacterized protein n=1 Tax=Eutreptiella gymnastica TaxID=73025 RepID=A0A7S4CC57_9EUGL
MAHILDTAKERGWFTFAISNSVLLRQNADMAWAMDALELPGSRCNAVETPEAMIMAEGNRVVDQQYDDCIWGGGDLEADVEMLDSCRPGSWAAKKDIESTIRQWYGQ